VKSGRALCVTAVLVLCLLGCSKDKAMENVANMAFIPLCTVAQSDQDKVVAALAQYDIVSQVDTTNSGVIDVINTDKDRAMAIVQKDSEQKGYTVWWAK